MTSSMNEASKTAGREAAAAPLMSPADRAHVGEVLRNRLKVDAHFMFHLAGANAKMKQKLRRARGNIAARPQQQPPPSAVRPHRRRAPETRGQLCISFLRHSSLQIDEHRLRVAEMRSGVVLLNQRLTHWGLEQAFMEDDGNCQFRAIAHQLFGNATEYNTIRRACVEYLLEHYSQYSCFFDGDEEWQRYLMTMAGDGTWGDELTLKTASNVFGCNVHVVTSEKEHYYMCYAPDDQEGGKGEVEDIFLAYISPIQYNSIRRAPPAAEEADQRGDAEDASPNSAKAVGGGGSLRESIRRPKGTRIVAISEDARPASEDASPAAAASLAVADPTLTPDPPQDERAGEGEPRGAEADGVGDETEREKAAAEARTRNAAAGRRTSAEAPRMLGYRDESARFFDTDADTDSDVDADAEDERAGEWEPRGAKKADGVGDETEREKAKAEARTSNAAARRRTSVEAPRMLGYRDESARFFDTDTDADSDVDADADAGAADERAGEWESRGAKKADGVGDETEREKAKAEARTRNAAARRRTSVEAPRMLGYRDDSARFFDTDADADADVDADADAGTGESCSGGSKPASGLPQDEPAGAESVATADPTPAPDPPEDEPAVKGTPPATNEIQQGEGEGEDAGAHSVLLSPADRAQVKEIIRNQFKVDTGFLLHLVGAHMKMNTKLQQARARIEAQAGEDGDGKQAWQQQQLSTDVGRRKSGSRKQLCISFLQHSQLQRTEHQVREDEVKNGYLLLTQRLVHLRLDQVEMEDDGNCQFRAMAHQLFGEAEDHANVRFCCVEYLRANAEQFLFYFDGDREWQRYLTTMAAEGTWGDELTLKAASSVFGCNVHVVTSTKENYYLQYTPDDQDEDEQPAAASDAVTDIFLAYISPVHYNSIRLLSQY